MIKFIDGSKSFKLIKRSLISSLCRNHAEIPSDIFEALIKASLDENKWTDLDDSITRSDINDDDDEDDDIEKEPEPLTLLQIPEECKILSFNYLREWELNEVQQTCRCYMATQRHETIVSLIKICQKLEACNKSQLITWMIKFIDSSKSFKLIKRSLIRSLCRNHADIPSDIFEALIKASPDENKLTDLDDSITKSEVNDDNDEYEDIDVKEPLTFLQIPRVCKLLSFNYLKEGNLEKIQRTCRCLCLAASDPNSLYYLRPHAKKNYHHDWYSRVKSLNAETNCNVPYFRNITKCTLSGHATSLLHGHINHSTLRHLSFDLYKTKFNSQLLQSFIQLVNLEHLCLHLTRSSRGSGSIANDEKIQKMFSDPAANKFNKLTHFHVKNPGFMPSIFFFWILCNNQHKKTFTIEAHYMQSEQFVDLFRSHSTMSRLAFNNINKIELLILHKNKRIGDILEGLSLKKLILDEFKLKLTLDTTHTKLLISPSLFDVLSRCKRSELDVRIHDGKYYQDSEWLQCYGNTKWFNKISIDIIQNSFGNEVLKFMTQNRYSSVQKLKCNAKKVASNLMNEYNAWKAILSTFTPEKMQQLKMEQIKFDIYFWFEGFIDRKNADMICPRHPFQSDREYGTDVSLKIEEIWDRWEEVIPIIIEHVKQCLRNNDTVEDDCDAIKISITL